MPQEETYFTKRSFPSYFTMKTCLHIANASYRSLAEELSSNLLGFRKASNLKAISIFRSNSGTWEPKSHWKVMGGRFLAHFSKWDLHFSVAWAFRMFTSALAYGLAKQSLSPFSPNNIASPVKINCILTDKRGNTVNYH